MFYTISSLKKECEIMEENKLSIQNELAIEDIKNLIYTIRGKQVMMDSDVANIYHCETKYINRVVKRNIERFPEEFCFQLNENEFEVLRCQFVTLNENGRGQHRKYLPYVFTEQGIAMLSALLKSDISILCCQKSPSPLTNCDIILFNSKRIL